MWPFGAMGESPDRTHPNSCPRSPPPTDRRKRFRVAVCKVIADRFSRHLRFSFTSWLGSFSAVPTISVASGSCGRSPRAWTAWVRVPALFSLMPDRSISHACCSGVSANSVPALVRITKSAAVAVTARKHSRSMFRVAVRDRERLIPLRAFIFISLLIVVFMPVQGWTAVVISAAKQGCRQNARNSQFGDESQQVPFSLRPTRLREVHVCRQKSRCRNLHPSKRMRLSTIAAACPHSGTALERSRQVGSP